MSKHLIVSNRQIENGTHFKNPQELEAYLKLHKEIDTLIFPFWSWIVEKWMLDTYKCYGFHTGPLLEGKGRGGSPIDNLKLLGIGITTLCAFEMDEGIDTGRVRVAIPLRLNYPKSVLINDIDRLIPDIVDYLLQDNSTIPEKFKRIQS